MTIKTDFTNICAAITSSVITALAKGQRPWLSRLNLKGKRTHVAFLPPYNPRTGTYYSGMNVGILWVQAYAKGFDLPYWLTVNQAQEINPEAHTLKGTKATKVVFTKEIEKRDASGNPVLNSSGKPEMIRFTQSYCVFNTRQFGNLPEVLTAPYPAPRMRNDELDAFFARVGAKVRWHGSVKTPHYRPSTDQISMPRFLDFVDARAAYATLAHEMMHWTMKKDRAGRPYTLEWVHETIRQGLSLSEASQAVYDFEELVAEMGAAYICAVVGLEPVVRNDSVAYLGRYIKLLGVDPSILMKASTLAVAGANFILEKALQGAKKLPQAPDYSSVPKKAAAAKLLGRRVGRGGRVIKRRKRVIKQDAQAFAMEA